MKADRTLEVVSVDIEGIMSGRVADIPLKENDVLFVATKTEKMSDRTLTIRGEVQYPGVYKYADNETVEDFIIQAGGLTDKASLMNVSISRRVSDPKALRPDSVIAKTFNVALKDNFAVDGDRTLTLMPFDEVYVMRSPGYTVGRRRGALRRNLRSGAQQHTLERPLQEVGRLERTRLYQGCATHAQG